MADPEVPALTEEQMEQLRQAGAKLAAALTDMAAAFATSMSTVDWIGLAEQLKASRDPKSFPPPSAG